MSPQLQQLLIEIDRLSSTEQIQVIEHINARQRSSVLETIANLRSQQKSFKIPEEIDAEILEEKAAWTNGIYRSVIDPNFGIDLRSLHPAPS
jgi:transposase